MNIQDTKKGCCHTNYLSPLLPRLSRIVSDWHICQTSRLTVIVLRTQGIQLSRLDNKKIYFFKRKFCSQSRLELHLFGDDF